MRADGPDYLVLFKLERIRQLRAFDFYSQQPTHAAVGSMSSGLCLLLPANFQ